jgi:tripartite-type tricarboxylate transporter receptor subunit TctC
MFISLRMIAVAMLLSASVPVAAQTWPTRPVTLVVTFAAGSGDDVLARILSPRLSELLGQQVIIENIGGAGGMTGVSRVAKAAPDGYQLVLGGIGTFAANQTLYKNPPYNAATDFTPVAFISEQPMVLITRKDFPARNLQEFIAYARANEAKIQFGSGGSGSATHLACALMNSSIGVNVTHVPYRSAALSIQDMVGGRVDYACPITSTALGHIQGDQVKPIAILSKERSPILQDLASAHEQGIGGFDTQMWNAFFLPKGTPSVITKKLHDATIAAMNTPAVQGRLREIGGVFVAPERRSPGYLQKFVESEINKWAGPIRASGLSME